MTRRPASLKTPRRNGLKTVSATRPPFASARETNSLRRIASPLNAERIKNRKVED